MKQHSAGGEARDETQDAALRRRVAEETAAALAASRARASEVERLIEVSRAAGFTEGVHLGRAILHALRETIARHEQRLVDVGTGASDDDLVRAIEGDLKAMGQRWADVRRGFEHARRQHALRLLGLHASRVRRAPSASRTSATITPPPRASSVGRPALDRDATTRSRSSR